ncbi:hypothetical protein BaRGS_00007619 [Batillaria attramentaria]|uniref:Uncharacterized protein n=1 Tax=Batillaria attramentaria TaxID=370345 RepID=A0ABD0LNT9_9CAEN
MLNTLPDLGMQQRDEKQRFPFPSLLQMLACLQMLLFDVTLPMISWAYRLAQASAADVGQISSHAAFSAPSCSSPAANKKRRNR